MSARSRIKGPRFALTNPEKCTACIKCVYGNGEHAEWCEKRLPFEWASLDNLLPQRAPAEKVQPVETELESANA